MKKEKIPLTGLESIILGLVIGLSLAGILVLGIHGCETISKYDYSGKWNHSCDLWHCE